MSSSIKSVLQETRSFAPGKDFAAAARVGSMAAYEELYRHADRDPDGFWGEIAGELAWSKPWERVLEWKHPDAKWFIGGKLNVTANCLDRLHPKLLPQHLHRRVPHRLRRGPRSQSSTNDKRVAK